MWSQFYFVVGYPHKNQILKIKSKKNPNDIMPNSNVILPKKKKTHIYIYIEREREREREREIVRSTTILNDK